MDAFLTSRGRRLIGWDEILEGGLASNATVMSWRGEAGGIAAAHAGHDVVMSPNQYTYFDYYQSWKIRKEPLGIGGNLPLKKVYHYEPVPQGLSPEEARHVLGAQAQVWTEYIPTPKHAEYMIFPRACALAEVLWTPAELKDYASFTSRLEKHFQRFKVLDVNYRP
jgi:hexosaminidase